MKKQSKMSMHKDLEKQKLELLRESMQKSWLHVIPLKEFNYTLSKQEFWDVIRLRYNWPIPNLPLRCACGERFDTQHSMSCKKGGLVTLRHNELRDITAKLLDEVCKDVQVEPMLDKLMGEEFKLLTANCQHEARLDISANGCWVKDQKTFVDIRVFDPKLLDTRIKV